MKYYTKKMITMRLQRYGEDGCSVNKLFSGLACGKNDFIKAKNQLIKEGVISTKNDGKQKKILYLNSNYLSSLDRSFAVILQRQERQASEKLEELKKFKPLFRHTKDKNEISGVKVANQKVSILLEGITKILETVSHYLMVFTLRYYLDPKGKDFDLTENQNQGFATIRSIIEKLIKQHKDEEKELRNFLLWGMTSSFSYVV